ncbi:MAG: hypothetical protein M3016_00375 [Actinomycetota bacterium]|nr:hypothetical protein [Actinomycetota bacterium]
MPTRFFAVLCTLAVAACASACAASTGGASRSSTAQTSSATSPAGSRVLSYEGIALEPGPPLGSAATTQTSRVDGISCGPSEQLAYHIHVHLTVFDNGHPYALPAGVGIPGSVTEQSSQGPLAVGGQCIYWLHTHASDGVIHIESPVRRLYTLGEFFDLWNQPLSSDRVASLRGHVTAFVNGEIWKGSLRDIPLYPHTLIQFSLGAPPASLISVDWSQTNL